MLVMLASASVVGMTTLADASRTSMKIPIACIQCRDTPDDGQWTCPKYVEYFIK
jgi:hypothetical protein